MFGFGRRAAIRNRAGQLGKTVHHLVSCLGSQSFEEFVEAMGRKEFKQTFIDYGTGLSFGNKAYGFSELGRHGNEFSFLASYRQDSEPQLIVSGNEQYSGLIITGGAAQGIYVDLKETAIALSSLGRDAKAMQAELLKFPGFENIDQLLASL